MAENQNTKKDYIKIGNTLFEVKKEGNLVKVKENESQKSLRFRL